MSEEFEEQVNALGQFEEYKKDVESFFSQRSQNMPPNIEKLRKQHQQNRNNLKSDLKKTTAFVKKIKLITSDGLLQCIRDVQTLNLTLYISEIVSSLVETTIKVTDVTNVLKLCQELHIRYEDFTVPLINRMKDSVLSQDEEVQKRKRIQVRMMIEFYQLGLFTDESFFLVLFRDLIGKTHPNQQIDLSGLVTFVKYAAEVLMGYHPKRHHQLAKLTGKSLSEFPSKLIASQRSALELQMQLTAICEKLSVDLEKSFQELRSKEKRFEKDKLIHGVLSEQKVAELENSKRLFEKLMSSLSSISDATGLDIVPELKEEEENLDGSAGISLWEGGNTTTTGVDFGVWGDAESKSFYEDLPDLLSMVPLTALGFTPEQAAEMKETWKVNKEKLSIGENTAPIDSIDEEIQEEEENSNEKKGDTSNLNEPIDNEEIETPESNSTALTMHNKLMTLLQEKLPEAVNKQKCDDFCVSFCYLQTKKSKKHLINALLRVPRTRYELIPNYARIAASLIRLYPEISQPLLDGLLKEFHGMLRTKHQQHIENKLKNIRYLGELIKFNIAPPITAFRIFQKLINDFIHHNIEICATFLESCGRYLYLTPYTHERLEQVLATIMRLRRAKNLDYRQQTALESAYFTVKPPERRQKIKKEYTLIQKYIQHLLFMKLNKTNVEMIIKQLRKLPWNNTSENIEFYIIKFTLKLARVKYSNVPLVTDCLSGLSRYHPNVLVRLVDVIFEELSRGFDAPHHREQQRLISYVRLLGELFNFSALKSVTIFELLYYILSYGYTEELIIPSVVVNNSSTSTTSTSLGGSLGGSTSVSASSSSSTQLPNTSSTSNTTNTSNESLIHQIFHSKKFNLFKSCDIDPPHDYFRIQLICEILESCGMYFTKGISKIKLNDFLLYFQRYLLIKVYLPSHVEFSVLDMFDNLELHAHEMLKREKKSSNGNHVISTELCFPRYSKHEELDVIIQQLEELKEKNVRREEEEEEEDEEDDGDDHSTQRNKQENLDETGGIDEDDEDEYLRDNAGLDGGVGGGVGGGGDRDRDDGQISDAEAKKLMRMRVIEEDEEFEKAFKSLMLESVESAKPSSNTIGIRGGGGAAAGDRMAIPAFLPPPKNIVHTSRGNDDSGDEESSDEEGLLNEDENQEQGKPVMKSMPFKLLGRDNKGRLETRRLFIPQDTKISIKLLQSTEHQKIEKEKLKEKVLLYECLQATGGVESQSPAGVIPVEYLGNRDHFARGPTTNQPSLESTKWRSSSSAASSSSSSSAAAATTSASASSSSSSLASSSHLQSQSHTPQSTQSSQSTQKDTSHSRSNHSSSSSSSSSSSYQQQHHQQQQQLQAAPVTGYDLNLDAFLAISSAAESRKLSSTAPHKANVVGNSYKSNKSHR